MRRPNIEDLITAIENNDIAAIELYTSSSGTGADANAESLSLNLNQSNDNDISPLLAAIESGNPHLVPLLIKKGQNVHAYDRWGYTALHRACCTSDTSNLEGI